MILRMKALVAALCALALVACGGDIPQSVKPNSTEKLVIVAATELRDMESLIQRASADLGFEIEMQYPDGTIANSVSLKEGAFDGVFDATWFATNKYVDLYGADTKQGPSTSVATSPIAFGVHAAKARELGWTNKQPTWDDITTAVKEGKFSYGMTDPSRSNSGFSALVSVATANADTGAALQLTDMPGLQEPLQSFFEGQKMTAGSSGWLEDSFVSDPGHVDAIINYESVLLQMKKQGSTDIEVVVPADGVVTADYPLAPLAQPRSPEAAEQTSRLVEWLKEHNKDIVTDTMRRPADPAVQLLSEHQKNNLIELPFPARQSVAEDLLDTFKNELRAPGRTVFVLDKSGSMEGDRMASLHGILQDLVAGTAKTQTGPVGFHNRERITVIGFNSTVDQPVTTEFRKNDATKSKELTNAITSLKPYGQTAIYDALITAYRQFQEEPPKDGEIPSIVLMSDGGSNTGAKYQDFVEFHQTLSPEQRRIPVFVILYGEANAKEMEQVATLTGGKAFDAQGGDLGGAFKEIRGYQ